MPAGRDHDLLEVNRRFYDPLWTDTQLVEPERFNTWPLVDSLVSPSRQRLEIAPGLRPRLPIDGTLFVDISMPAIAKLRARGASAVLGLVSKLPFPDHVFDPVCAFDIIEHVDDEDGALSEISRVAMPSAALLLSVPLHPSYWTPFDDMVGHAAPLRAGAAYREARGARTCRGTGPAAGSPMTRWSILECGF